MKKQIITTVLFTTLLLLVSIAIAAPKITDLVKETDIFKVYKVDFEGEEARQYINKNDTFINIKEAMKEDMIIKEEKMKK